MKKLIALVLAAVLALSLASASALQIAVPNDPTNEGRALLLLQTAGYITLKEDAGITATVADIADNPLGIEFYEAEAAALPNLLADVDYAIINNNFALDAGLVPSNGLLVEAADSPYVNVLSVKEGNEDAPLTKALIAALSSQQVVDFFATTYPNGDCVCTLTNITDGYDPDVDYDALAGQTIVVGGTPNPHVYVLNIAKEILAAKNITLQVMEYTDYVLPNEALEAGDLYANFFAHSPYQENFNAENGTHIVNVLGIHVEPMAMYGGKQSDLSALTAQ